MSESIGSLGCKYSYAHLGPSPSRPDRSQARAWPSMKSIVLPLLGEVR